MIGERIRNLLENQWLYSKKEVAKRMGISFTNLYRLYQRDSVETKYLTALCNLFDVPITYFFDKKYASNPSLWNEAESEQNLQRGYERMKDLHGKVRNNDDSKSRIQE